MHTPSILCDTVVHFYPEGGGPKILGAPPLKNICVILLYIYRVPCTDQAYYAILVKHIPNTRSLEQGKGPCSRIPP